MSNVAAVGHISASTAEDWLKCERLYYFKQILGLSDEDSVALMWGRVMDYAFDAYYRTRTQDTILRRHFKLLVEAMVDEVHRRWPGDVTEEMCEKGRTKDRAVKVCEMYAEKWLYDGVEVVVPAMRENQYVDIPGTKYRLAVRLDKVVQWNGTLRVMEHKTTSQLTANTLNRYDPNVQNKLYIWAARRLPLLGQRQVAGMLMDITCVNVQKVAFQRDVVSQTPEQDREVEDFLRATVEDIERATETTRFLPRWTSCSMYGECSFRKVCKMSPGYRESILAGYRKKEERENDGN